MIKPLLKQHQYLRVLGKEFHDKIWYVFAVEYDDHANEYLYVLYCPELDAFKSSFRVPTFETIDEDEHFEELQELWIGNK